MNLGSFRILLPFFRTSWCVGILNSAIFNSFHNWVEFGMILEGLQNFGGGGLNTPNPPLSTPLQPDRPCMKIWCLLIACWIPKATNTQNRSMKYLLFLHCNNGCTNVPQCSVHMYIACLVGIVIGITWESKCPSNIFYT